MLKFTATFSNGETISRKTDRKYAFAWAVLHLGKIVDSGFSGDMENAIKSAQSHLPRGPSARDRKNPNVRRYWAKLAKDNGFTSVDAFIADIDAKADAKRAEMSVEIIEVQE